MINYHTEEMEANGQPKVHSDAACQTAQSCAGTAVGGSCGVRVLVQLEARVLVVVGRGDGGGDADGRGSL